ncbi:MAG: methyltransferase domain-containing protein, partial [Actinomycetota bacterium]
MSEPSAPPVDVDQLRSLVGDIYGEVASRPDGEYHFHTGRAALDHLGYPSTLTEPLPDDAVDAFAGVTYVFDPGLPARGDRVIDVGSGAGADALIAAQAVADEGAVVGIDMNERMLERARTAAGQAGIHNVEFRRGLIEPLPV